MFRSHRKLFVKLAILCLMTAGIFVAQNSKVSAFDCLPCPENYHCNWVTGWCECNCPDGGGGCPSFCA